MTPPLKIAVIGAGHAGRSFAARCASAGHRVTLEDVMPHKLRHAEDLFATLGHHVVLVNSVEDAVVDVDLVVDFVPDELESKLEIFSLIDRMAPPRSILLTPSDTLCVTDLASCTYRPERVLMMRGQSPTRLLTTRDTAQNASEIAVELLESIGEPCQVEQDPDLPQLMKNMNLPADALL